MPARIHLSYLDGIRGLAALYVALFHLMPPPGLAYESSRWFYYLTLPLRYGHFAVDLFIVLSGYCLMLPVARSQNRNIPGGIGSFFYRRARRILPPYWAALVFTLLMILLSRFAGSRVGADNGSVFTPANLITHALLIHNWFLPYHAAINLPMWTVAMEWQIYFVFVALLIPVWKSWGTLPLIALALTIGLLPEFLLSDTYNLNWTRPWYIGLFAFGMTAATVHFRPQDAAPNRLAALPWGWIAAALLTTVILIETLGGIQNSTAHLWAKDILVGSLAATTLIALTQTSANPIQPRLAPGLLILNLLQSRPLVALGAFSYSLYLIHEPVGWTIKFILAPLHLSTFNQTVLRLMLAPVYIVPVAYVFHLIFERPFMSPAQPRLQPIVPDRLASAVS